MSTKMVALSVSLLLDAGSLDELDAATEAARSAFAAPATPSSSSRR